MFRGKDKTCLKVICWACVSQAHWESLALSCSGSPAVSRQSHCLGSTWCTIYILILHMATFCTICHSFYECFALSHHNKRRCLCLDLVPLLHMAFSLATRSGLLDIKGKVGRSVHPYMPVSIIKLWGLSHFSFADSAEVLLAAIEIPVAAVSSASITKNKICLSHSGQSLLVWPVVHAVRAVISLPSISGVHASSTA